MHTRKKSRRGRYTLPGNQRTSQVKWQLIQWLGVVLLSAVGAVSLVMLLSSLSEQAQRLALTGGFTGDNAVTAAVYSAASRLYWAAKSAITRVLQREHPGTARPANGTTPARQDAGYRRWPMTPRGPTTPRLRYISSPLPKSGKG